MNYYYFLISWKYLVLLILQDDARCQLGVLQRELEELKGERGSAQSRFSLLQSSLQELQEGSNTKIMKYRAATN